MKEFDKLMDALKEEKVIGKIKFAFSVVPEPEGKTPEKLHELRVCAVKGCLIHALADSERLKDLFADYSYEVGLNNVAEAIIEDAKTELPDETQEALKTLMGILLK